MPLDSFGRYTVFVMSRKTATLRKLAAGMLLTGVLCMTGGCSEPLFSPDEPRSQYDRMDRVRERRAAQYYFDEYGDRKPNIRQRLMSAE